ncbi:hypothetical protein [Roseiconus lacunae]|uniref:hypothetical protein n=1 Tax=Roseiconus lacunae TaxID=2605694 RepID=UPI001E36DA98|nr:hypothetical protein [Roseiconus lacunae]MCD0463724.1 hypothetical protein [Roseiconus lacunae]
MIATISARETGKLGSSFASAVMLIQVIADEHGRIAGGTKFDLPALQVTMLSKPGELEPKVMLEATTGASSQLIQQQPNEDA